MGPLFLEIGPGIPKRAPSEKRWALMGSPGRPWRLKKSFWEGSESDPENDPKKYPEMRASGRSKTCFGDIRMASARFECRRKKHRKGVQNDLQNGPQKHAKGDRRRPRSAQGAPERDFDSFGWASRASRGAKRGVPEMTPKMDSTKIDLFEPGGVYPLLTSPVAPSIPPDRLLFTVPGSST